VPHWQKGVQARQRQERGRGGVALHDPTAWTVGIVVATGLVLLARHPIARALGTEVTTPSSGIAATAPVAAAAPSGSAPALSLPLGSAPTHAPVDPFRALVTAGGKVLAQTPPATTSRRASTSAPAARPAPSCAGTTHRVGTGDTLWTIAARAVRSNDTGRVTIAWHRLYDANRGAVGSNPSLLDVGTTLCVPASLSRG